MQPDRRTNGDCWVLDYAADTVFLDGPYSFPVARYLAPDAPLYVENPATRGRHLPATQDQLDRIKATHYTEN